MRIAVIGTGSIGAMALWRLAERGIDVTGFDQFSPGHDRGAAGGESRIFRVAYREGSEYVPILQQARELWRELDDAFEHRLFYDCGFATIGADSHPEIDSIRRSAATHDLSIEELGTADAARRVPEHPVAADEVLILDPAGGLIRPELSVLAAAARAEQRGATIRTYTPVTGVTEERDGVSVSTEAGTERFDHVIVAPGPWVEGSLLPAVFPLQPKELTATWFPRRSSDLFVLGHTPTAVRLGEPGFSCFPAVDGAGVKVIAHGAFSEITGPDALPRSGAVEAVQRASRFAAQALPGVVPSPIRVATFSDAYTPDHHSLLGRLTEDSRIVVAAGFSGHGFKMAPAFGEILAGMISGESFPSLAFLRPDRFLAG